MDALFTAHAETLDAVTVLTELLLLAGVVPCGDDCSKCEFTLYEREHQRPGCGYYDDPDALPF